MRYSHRLMLCCLVCAAIISQRLPAQTAAAKDKDQKPAAATAAEQKAKADDKAAKEKAQAEEAQRQQDEKARVEADREKELKRIELEVLKAAEARGLKPVLTVAPAPSD